MMRCCLAVLFAATVVCGQPTSLYGPRITIHADGLATGDVLADIGRQMNRLFTGTAVQSKSRTAPLTMNLDDATVAETLEAIDRATNCRVTRASRFVYRVDASRKTVGEVGQPLGDYQCWLRYVRYSFYSYFYPTNDSRRAYVSPYIAIEAPSDPESLRIQSVSAPGALTPGNDELGSLSRRSRTTGPWDNDPRIWLLSDLLEAPAPDVMSLKQLWFDVTFAARLDAMRFDFLLAGGGGQLQSDGEFDARLEAPEDNDWAGGTTVELQRALGVDPEQPTGPERLWVEGRFYDADDRPVFTQLSSETPTQDEALWRNRWSFKVYKGDQKALPVRLEVQLYVPSGTGATERVTFEHVPLPPRSDDPEVRP